MTRYLSFAAALAVGLPLMLSNALCRPAAAQSTANQPHMSQLHPGDSVTIQVYGEPNATSVYVGDDGNISVPLVGAIPVTGTTPVEAADRVAKALKDGGYFVDPHVTLVVAQSSSQLVSVLGEVGSSGRYPINPQTTIVDLLAQAGGLKDTASDMGYLIRNDGSGRLIRYPVSLSHLGDSNGSPDAPTLAGGDSLVVPQAEHVYVVGEVTTPGTYSIEPGMTVMQAIARAGGINERGSERRIQLKRRDKNGQYQVLHPKLGDPIQANDMIRIKESIF